MCEIGSGGKERCHTAWNTGVTGGVMQKLKQEYRVIKQMSEKSGLVCLKETQPRLSICPRQSQPHDQF